MKKISVILPCYNEEKRIESTLKATVEFSKKNPNYEFIFVDDGSRDKTAEILNKKIVKMRGNKIKLISYKKNMGKGYAVKIGVASAEGDYICFTDSDLAYSLEHLKTMEKMLERCDIVIGRRGLASENIKNIPTLRRIIGIGYNLFSRAILNLNYKDMQAGIKGFRKEAAKKLFQKQIIKGWSFDTEVLYLAQKNGYKIREMPAKISNNDSYKTSKVKIVRDSIKMFLSLLKIRLNDAIGKYK